MSDTDTIHLDLSALDAMMPLHVVTDRAGVVRHAGPTLARICSGQPVIGRKVEDLFEPRKLDCAVHFSPDCVSPGTKLRLRLRDAHRTQLIGTAAPLPGGTGLLINLSFGISVVDAVARYDLAGSDFAATDLTLELLYLAEANSAAMAESRKLTARLEGARNEAVSEAGSDMLTGLANRRVLEQKLARALARNEPFTLMHLDLDYFKAVNDTLGHAAGDAVLIEVARILREETRENDVVARVGGDEFVLLFDRLTDAAKLAGLAGRIIARLEEPVPFGDQQCRISGSIGMVASDAYAQPDAAQMMEDADRALYASKERGRACFTHFTPEFAAQ